MDGQKATYIKGLGTGLVLATALFLFTTLMSKEDKKETVMEESVQVVKVEKPNIEESDKTEEASNKVENEEVKASEDQDDISQDKESSAEVNDDKDQTTTTEKDSPKNDDPKDNASSNTTDDAKNGSDDAAEGSDIDRATDPSTDKTSTPKKDLKNTQDTTPSQDADEKQNANIHSVIIPADYTSRGVSIILAEAEVLAKEEIESFNQYITLRKRDLHIQQGTFVIPVGSSYDEIISIISPKR